jgi:hypothetical protein
MSTARWRIEAEMSDEAQAFEAGMTFDYYMADLRVHRDDAIAHYARLAGIVDELRGNPPLPNIRVLAIAEDWCPDCVFNVPILARLVEASSEARLRIVRRPECKSVADRYRGRDDVSHVPTFIFLDDADGVIGHWSERCASSQLWFDTFTKDHPMPKLEIRDGIPGPILLSWMKLRIASERDRFYGGVWRGVLAEIHVILGKIHPRGFRFDLR